MKKPPRRNAKPGSGAKPSFGKAGAGSKATAVKRPFGKPAGEKRPFGTASAEKRPFGKASDDDRFVDKPKGARRPFGDAAAPPRRPFAGGDAENPPAKRPFGKPVFGRPSGVARRGLKVDLEDGRGAGDREFTAPPAKRIGRPPRPFIGNEPEGETPTPRGRRPMAPAMDFDDVVYGVHAVDEALKAGEKLRKLYVGTDRSQDAIVHALVEAAREAGTAVAFEGAAFFARFPYKAHQNIVAIGEPFNYISLDEAIAIRTEKRLIVILDHLTDPHNVGAILRSAECAGAQAAVLPDRRSAGVNATVRKGAAGATSHLPIAKVGNLSGAIRALKAAGFVVVGAALEDGALALNDAPLGEDIALVIGSEGVGLTKLIAKNCDQLVKIPLLGKVESLNASVAAGVLLYEIVRRRLGQTG